MHLLKSAFLSAFSLLGLPDDRAVILMYHSISPNSHEFMNVVPTEFEMHMQYLVKSGRPVISLTELVRRLRNGESLGGSIVITFDDGYEDNYINAFPVLRKYGLPATIFVTTGLIGRADSYGVKRLTVEQMHEMKSVGLIDIAPHTATHPKLGMLSASEASREMEESRAAIAQILGTKPSVFAYPYGNHTTETAELARAAGFDGAVTIKEGLVNAGSDPWRLPRVSIDRSTTMMQFRGKLTRAIEVYESCKRLI